VFCIFPEGRKDLGDKTIKARGGVSFLSHKAQLPIIPVLIQDAHLLTVNDFISRKRKVKVIFGNPFYTKDIFKNKEIILNDPQNDHEIIASIIMEKIMQTTLVFIDFFATTRRQIIRIIYNTKQTGANTYGRSINPSN